MTKNKVAVPEDGRQTQSAQGRLDASTPPSLLGPASARESTAVSPSKNGNGVTNTLNS